MSKIKIYSWNVNGIRAVLKKDAFLPFIQKHDPDILCLQETKAQQGQAQVDLAQYEEVWNSADRPGYSGTAIFTKHSPLSVTKGLPADIVEKFELSDGFGDSGNEGRVLAIEFDAYILVTVYTPNAKDDLSRLSLRHDHWDPAFLEYMQQLEKKKPVVFCGDLNVAHTEDDLARPKENKGKTGFTDEEREGIAAMVKAGYVDSFRKFHQGNGHYSWWSYRAAARARNVGWRIDYVMVSPKLADHLLSADIHSDVMGSDHCPVSITLDV